MLTLFSYLLQFYMFRCVGVIIGEPLCILKCIKVVMMMMYRNM